MCLRAGQIFNQHPQCLGRIIPCAYTLRYDWELETRFHSITMAGLNMMRRQPHTDITQTWLPPPTLPSPATKQPQLQYMLPPSCLRNCTSTLPSRMFLVLLAHGSHPHPPCANLWIRRTLRPFFKETHDSAMLHHSGHPQPAQRPP